MDQIGSCNRANFFSDNLFFNSLSKLHKKLEVSLMKIHALAHKFRMKKYRSSYVKRARLKILWIRSSSNSNLLLDLLALSLTYCSWSSTTASTLIAQTRRFYADIKKSKSWSTSVAIMTIYSQPLLSQLNARRVTVETKALV